MREDLILYRATLKIKDLNTHITGLQGIRDKVNELSLSELQEHHDEVTTYLGYVFETLQSTTRTTRTRLEELTEANDILRRESSESEKACQELRRQSEEKIAAALKISKGQIKALETVQEIKFEGSFLLNEKPQTDFTGIFERYKQARDENKRQEVKGNIKNKEEAIEKFKYGKHWTEEITGDQVAIYPDFESNGEQDANFEVLLKKHKIESRQKNQYITMNTKDVPLRRNVKELAMDLTNIPTKNLMLADGRRLTRRFLRVMFGASGVGKSYTLRMMIEHLENTYTFESMDFTFLYGTAMIKDNTYTYITTDVTDLSVHAGMSVKTSAILQSIKGAWNAKAYGIIPDLVELALQAGDVGPRDGGTIQNDKMSFIKQTGKNDKSSRGCLALKIKCTKANEPFEFVFLDPAGIEKAYYLIQAFYDCEPLAKKIIEKGIAKGREYSLLQAQEMIVEAFARIREESLNNVLYVNTVDSLLKDMIRAIFNIDFKKEDGVLIKENTDSVEKMKFYNNFMVHESFHKINESITSINDSIKNKNKKTKSKTIDEVPLITGGTLKTLIDTIKPRAYIPLVPQQYALYVHSLVKESLFVRTLSGFLVSQVLKPETTGRFIAYSFMTRNSEGPICSNIDDECQSINIGAYYPITGDVQHVKDKSKRMSVYELDKIHKQYQETSKYEQIPFFKNPRYPQEKFLLTETSRDGFEDIKAFVVASSAGLEDDKDAVTSSTAYVFQQMLGSDLTEEQRFLSAAIRLNVEKTEETKLIEKLEQLKLDAGKIENYKEIYGLEETNIENATLENMPPEVKRDLLVEIVREMLEEEKGKNPSSEEEKKFFLGKIDDYLARLPRSGSSATDGKTPTTPATPGTYVTPPGTSETPPGTSETHEKIQNTPEDTKNIMALRRAQMAQPQRARAKVRERKRIGQE